MTDEFGAGPALNRGWDFVVDSTGDIKTITGLDELEKDLAFRSEQVLDDFLGRPINSTTRQKVKLRLRGVFDDDARVQTVNQVEVERTGRNEITVSATVTTFDNKDYDLVFEVGG